MCYHLASFLMLCHVAAYFGQFLDPPVPTTHRNIAINGYSLLRADHRARSLVVEGSVA